MFDNREPQTSAYVSGLEILVRADEMGDVSGDGHGSKGIRRNRDGSGFTSTQVRVEQIKTNLERTVEQLRSIFENIAEVNRGFPLKEVQVSFEVTAKGGIRLIGSSEIEGKGGITLVFGAKGE
ncbi:hypothetical protein ACGFZJ_21780 [Streptomyces sp. NPDC048253]|uniref:Pepco domain-containing protein n=1 Tax=Streptomyces sp. NPDC048253 TaxID=3365524 RepID=UPI00371A2472